MDLELIKIKICQLPHTSPLLVLKSKEFKLTNSTTILEASLNEVLMLAKDENNSLSLLILSRFCT
ncbi:hypothetical protein YC2023_031559 [Brassica napus]